MLEPLELGNEQLSNGGLIGFLPITKQHSRECDNELMVAMGLQILDFGIRGSKNGPVLHPQSNSFLKKFQEDTYDVLLIPKVKL